MPCILPGLIILASIAIRTCPPGALKPPR